MTGSDVRVVLSPAQYAIAAEVARGREASAIEHNRKEVYGAIADDSEIVQATAAAAEFAVALWTGLPWTGLEVIRDPYRHRRRADVGEDVQVVWTRTESLIVHPPDPDDHRFVCTKGIGRTLFLMGWRYACEVRTLVPFGNDPRGVAYMLPIVWLRPMSTWGEP